MAKGNDSIWRLLAVSATCFLFFLHITHPRVVTVPCVGEKDGSDTDLSPTTAKQPLRLVDGAHYTSDYNISHLQPSVWDPHAHTLFRYPYPDPATSVILSRRPYIVYMPGFLSASECDSIIKGAGRNSTALLSGWPGAPNGNSDVGILQRRLTDLTKIDSEEYLEVREHDVGAKYETYEDQSNRAVTAFLFLNAVPGGGGEIWFPRANGAEMKLWGDQWYCQGGLRIRPERGLLVLLYHMKPTGEVDHDAVHAECPVVVGAKWSATDYLRK